MELELRDYLRVLRKRLWIVVGLIVLTLGAGAASTALTPRRYEAQAKLYVGIRQVSEADVTRGSAAFLLSKQLQESYAELTKTRSMSRRAIRIGNLDVPSLEIESGIRAQSINETQVMLLSFQSTSPLTAQRVVDAVAAALVETVTRIESPSDQGSEPAVRVSVIDDALTLPAPVSPKPVRNMALALVLGAMLGVGVAFLVDHFDTSVKTREDVETVLGVPVLAEIPRVDSHGADVIMFEEPQSPAAEALRKVRTAVQFMGIDKPVRTILVTSPMAQEGKTTTALNLAIAYAHGGMRTVLVEADLRRPSLHHVFDAPGDTGLSTCLAGQHKLEQSIARTPIPNLHCLLAGPLPPNPLELLASDRAERVLGYLRSAAEIVIIDSPPILPVADASALAARVDGVLLVARYGRTAQERLREAAELIKGVGGRTFGVVLDFRKARRSHDTYDYYGADPTLVRNAETPTDSHDDNGHASPAKAPEFVREFGVDLDQPIDD